MYPIERKQKLAENIYEMEVIAPDIAKKAKPGQFVVLRIDEFGERIPLTIAESSARTITLIFQAIGKTTNDLANLRKGNEVLDLAGPLGNPAELKEESYVCLVGGGVGAAEVYPLAKAIKKLKNRVVIIIGARSKEHIFWEDKFKQVCDNLIICTDDGSKGKKGFVTEALKELLDKDRPNYVIAIGPIIMMREVSKLTKARVKTSVGLNPIMIDGMGMCGGCRVVVSGRVRFCCVDGPEFDGHEVDWEELINRNKTYEREERSCKCRH